MAGLLAAGLAPNAPMLSLEPLLAVAVGGAGAAAGVGVEGALAAAGAGAAAAGAGGGGAAAATADGFLCTDTKVDMRGLGLATADGEVAARAPVAVGVCATQPGVEELRV